MTVWNVWDFRNSINKGKNNQDYLLKKRNLCCTINEQYDQVVITLPSKAHHLIYAYYKKTLFQIKFGRQRDWIKQIQLARENLWAANSQSHSHGPGLEIYKRDSSPVRGIWKNTLTKMIAHEEFFSKFNCDILIQFRWIKFVFHSRPPNYFLSIIHVWLTRHDCQIWLFNINHVWV